MNTQGNEEPTINITPKQKRFVKAVVQGNTYRAAARKAGYLSPDYGSVLLKQPHIQTALQAYMHKAGITDEVIARKLREGINARTVPRSDGGDRYDDQFIRKQFLDVILRIRGDYAPERFEAVNKQITLVIDNKMLEALKDSRAIDAEEVQYLEHTPITEIKDAINPDAGEGNNNGEAREGEGAWLEKRRTEGCQPISEDISEETLQREETS